MGDTGAGDPPLGGYGGNGHQLDYDDPYNPLNSDQIVIDGVTQKKNGIVQNESNYSVQRIKVFPNGVTDPVPKILEKVDIRPADGTSVALSGSWTTVGSSSFNMTGGGTGVFRNTGSADVGGDEVTFAYETVTGDFDKQVAISTLTSVLYNGDGTAIGADQVLAEPVPVDAWARAGLMVRSSESAYSQLIKIVVSNPEGANQVRVMGRGIDAQNYTQYSRNYSGVKATLPNQYIRMKRVGNAFTFYVSKDGVVWSLIGQCYQGLPETVLFGPYAAAALNPNDTKGNPDGLLARTVVSFKAYKDVELGDVSAPVLVSAGTLDKKTIGLKFSEAVDSATASLTANYTLSEGTVTGARIGISGDSVYLTVDGLKANDFTVTVNNLTDSTGNKIAANSSVSGKVTGLVSADIGFIQNPDARPTAGDDPYRQGQAVATASSDSPEVEIIGGGSNAWDPGDYLHYLYNPTPVSGDFDVAVKLSRYDRPNNTAGWGNSGVMLRSALFNPGEEFLNAGTKAPMVSLTTYMEGAGPVAGPGRGAIPLFRNSIHGNYGNGNAGFGAYGNIIGGIKGYYGDLRATDSAGTLDPDSSAISARWLRIQRTDATYTFSASWDGLNWAVVDTKSDLTLDRELPLLIGFSTMNDTGGGAPPQGGYGGNGHTLDPSDPLAAKVQNESNYSVQKVRIFSNASQIGVAKTQRLANGNVSVSFSGTLQSANTVN